MSLDPDKIYNEVLACGMDWADKKAAYEALDDNTKGVLAEILGRYMDPKTSKATAESYALASKEYRDYLASVSKARKEWLQAQVRYDSLKMLAELRRSEESSRRAEMRL